MTSKQDPLICDFLKSVSNGVSRASMISLRAEETTDTCAESEERSEDMCDWSFGWSTPASPKSTAYFSTAGSLDSDVTTFCRHEGPHWQHPLRRRSSFGHAHEVHQHFRRQIARRGLRKRMRKTLSEPTLLEAAEEIRQMDLFKKSFVKDKRCPVMLAYSSILPEWKLDEIETPSALFDLPYMRHHRASRHRLSYLSTFSRMALCRSWPSSATRLLTGGQSIQERLVLFWHLERVILRQPHAALSPLSEIGDTNDGHTADLGRDWSRRQTTLPWRLSRLCCCKSADHSITTCGLLSCSLGVHPKRIAGLQVASGCHSIARPDKRLGGEDAHFSVDGPMGYLGVADGVGQWNRFGCDASRFPRLFVKGCSFAVKNRRTHMDVEEEKQRPVHSRKKSLETLDVSTSASCIYGAGKQRPCSKECCKSALRANNGVHSGGAHTGSRPSTEALLVLKEGFLHTDGTWGACTAVVAGMNQVGNTIGIANIGDSAAIVLRRDLSRGRPFNVIFKTREQQHYPNCPYQLSRVPRESDSPILERKGWRTLTRLVSTAPQSGDISDGDDPNCADLYDIRVQEGDLIVLGSDGLFDNLFDHEIAHLASLCISPYESRVFASAEALSDAATGFIPHPSFITPPRIDEAFGIATPPKDIAKALAEAAFFRSVDPTAHTPFTKGKMDDITAVASWVL